MSQEFPIIDEIVQLLDDIAFWQDELESSKGVRAQVIREDLAAGKQRLSELRDVLVNDQRIRGELAEVQAELGELAERIEHSDPSPERKKLQRRASSRRRKLTKLKKQLSGAPAPMSPEDGREMMLGQVRRMFTQKDALMAEAQDAIKRYGPGDGMAMVLKPVLKAEAKIKHLFTAELIESVDGEYRVKADLTCAEIGHRARWLKKRLMERALRATRDSYGIDAVRKEAEAEARQDLIDFGLNSLDDLEQWIFWSVSVYEQLQIAGAI